MIQWDDKYATGVKRIDKQHKAIFKYADLLERAVKNKSDFIEKQQALEVLETYVKNHFGFEETCMEKYACPLKEENKSQHLKFVDKIHILKGRLELDETDPDDVLLGVVKLTENWITHHIIDVDSHLKNCIKENDNIADLV